MYKRQVYNTSPAKGIHPGHNETSEDLSLIHISSTTALGKRPLHHHIGMVILNTEASRPFDVPVIRLLLKRFCHT